jgi:CRP-like cAMP-binding protein
VPHVQKIAKNYAKDQIIIKEGDESGGKIFYLRQGQAIAEVGEKFVGTINAGEFFGELAAILGARRGATVRALINCEVDIFEGLQDDKLMRIIQREPKIGARMIETLAKRLKETSVDAAGQVVEKEKLVSRYRRAISGALFVLERLASVYKAPYLQELLDHLSSTSGIQLGNPADIDAATFKQTQEIIDKS